MIGIHENGFAMIHHQIRVAGMVNEHILLCLIIANNKCYKKSRVTDQTYIRNVSYIIGMTIKKKMMYGTHAYAVSRLILATAGMYLWSLSVFHWNLC